MSVAFNPHWVKDGPGRYTVTLSELAITFKTERDARRFCDAGSRATVEWKRGSK